MRLAAIEAGENGFVTVMQRHVALFYQRSDTLVVGFDNMKSREAPSPAYPWAFEFLKKEGFSHLGITMSRRNDWFRHPDLPAFFDRLQNEGFFGRFRRVIFYGSSMGGYGAMAYAGAAPGCQVLAFAPQTSLDPAVVPFETRYRNGFARGTWNGPYVDGVEGARRAGQVVVVVDPYEPIDMAHAARLDPGNLVIARMPWQGHNVARRLTHGGVLRDVVLESFAGDMTEARFSEIMRKVRGSQGYVRAVLLRAILRGHSKLVLQAIDDIGKSRPDWQFPTIRPQARADLEGYRVAAE